MKKVIDFNRLQKQEYFTPEMEVVKINAQQQLLAGSLSESLDDAEPMDSGELGSRELEDLLGPDITTLLNM
ncbi:MAG: hypothetical protein IJ190_12765 [Prevotella sp.]|nr:hypothetical protein [Prevotella sp.]